MTRYGRRVWPCVWWTPWLPAVAGGGDRATGAAAQRLRRTAASSTLLITEHPWHAFGGAALGGAAHGGGSYRTSFEVPAAAGWRQLRLTWSLAGVPSASLVRIELDGAPVSWAAEPHFDRQVELRVIRSHSP